jgi:hypothetical protein
VSEQVAHAVTIAYKILIEITTSSFLSVTNVGVLYLNFVLQARLLHLEKERSERTV